MKKFSFFPVLALFLALAASAFTTIEQKTTSAYWFPTDTDGDLVDETISISGHTVKPCNGDGDFCARGFSEEEVIVDNLAGTVTLKEEIDPMNGEPSLQQ